MDEDELPNMLGLHSLQPCLDQEENIVLEDTYPPTNDETILDVKP